MVLKTFQAVDLAAALERAREELGPDALVLATRDVPGPHGLGGVEVTVGAPRAESREPLTPSTPEPVERVPSSVLTSSGLTEDLARRFAVAARAEMTSTGDSGLARGRAMARLLPFGGLPDRPGVVFVVGPPGCGKTTTVAKLAARRMISSRGGIVLASADLDRVGGLEQARIFGRHLGVPVAAVETAEDLQRARRRAGTEGTVLVDTAGVGSKDFQRYELLYRLREACPDAELVVLVPAGLHRDEAAGILERFKALYPTRVAFSRVDDAGRIGDLVSAAAPARVPLAFLTTGHRVPGDLAEATPKLLASLLFRSAPEDRAIEETAP